MAPSQSAAIGVLHYTEVTIYKAQKALIAAKFNGIQIETRKFEVEKDARKPDFIAKNPTGKVPFLETDMGCIFTSNAIARYIARCRADTSLFGNCFNDEGDIDSWLEFCTHELEVPLMTWVYPCLGLLESDAKVTSDARADVKQALASLESRLGTSEFLAGSFLSVADIAIVCTLREGFVRVFDASFRKPYPKVCDWFERCVGLPQFTAVVGKTTLCVQEEKPQPVKFSPPSRGASAAAGAGKKEAPPQPPKEAKKAAPATAPAAAAAPAAAGGDVEAQIKAVGDEIRTLKEKLKGEGVTGKKLNDHEDIKELVAKLQVLKAQMGAGSASPQAASVQSPPPVPAAAAGGDVEAQVKAVGDEIRVLKEKLKGEGLSGKKVNEHEEVKRLVAKLQELKAQAPAGPASHSASPKAAPKSPEAAPQSTAAAPATATGGDIEAQVKAVGDEIRVLKEKLKGEGLSGKKVNEHEEVKALVTKLQALKADAATSPAKPTEPEPSTGGGDIEAQIKAVGDEVRALKEKLKADGLSGKKVNEHEQVKALVAKLQELKKQQG